MDAMREDARDYELPPLLDDAVPAHLLKSEILNCPRCDENGYRPNTTVCDHVDRSAVNERGMAKVRAALPTKKQRAEMEAYIRSTQPGLLEDLARQQRELGPPQDISDPEPEL